jgi:O-antigen ligase
LGFGREKTNSYLGLVEEVGLVGLLPLMAGLGYGVYRAARRFASVKWSDPIRMALLATVLSGLVHVNGEAWLTSASLEAFGSGQPVCFVSGFVHRQPPTPAR